MSALSSWNISKYQFLTNEDVLLEGDLLEKAAAIKKFQYLPLASELEKKTSIAKNQYQELEKVCVFYIF